MSAAGGRPLVLCVRHPHAAQACPQLEQALSQRLGARVVRSAAGDEVPRLTLFVVLPVGVRVDASVAEGVERAGARGWLVVLRYGDTEHVQPASLPEPLRARSSQLAYTATAGLADGLPLTRAGLAALRAALA